MSKMLFELNAPLYLAKAKEDLSKNNIWKYLRYYRMYLERFSLKYNGENITRIVEDKLFWSGKVALVKNNVYGLIVANIDNETIDPNGKVIKVDVSAENNWKAKGLKVGEDCIILYADETHIPPVLYIWAIANKIIDREDIIDTQDNMLRKPIMVDGVGEDFDNALVKASNVLSGVAWFNSKSKKNKDNVMADKPLEVLNLQVGNAYKSPELWDGRKHFEELICDYMGYTTVKNEKKERMNTDEVNNENSIGKTFYLSAVNLHKEGVKNASKIDVKIEFEEVLKQNEGGDSNDSKENLERVVDE